jgi:DNA-binding FadR family transcriptional regulator
MSEIFRKAKQSRIFQDVVDQIQEAILNGKFKPGDKLPSERELGELLGTSRGTLREALRILEQKGLIEIRLGVNGGAIVKETTWEQMSETLALLLRSHTVSPQHLAEFRQGLEGIVAALAAERATPEDMIGLNRLLEEARRHSDKGISHWKRFVKIDEQIHIALARISRNPIHQFIVETVHDNIDRYYDKYLVVGENEMVENYRDLEALIDAIGTKQIDKASHLAQEHVRRFNRYMDQKRP